MKTPYYVIYNYQVPLGIQLKSEQKYEDMVEILDDLQKYVPKVVKVEEKSVPGCDVPIRMKKHDFYQIALGD